MAISKVKTLLPLDVYAEHMAITGWLFNQVIHPLRPARGSCELAWLQSGHAGDPNRIVGRDDVARAIAVAERKVAAMLSYWPAPVWVQAEEHNWPFPERGVLNTLPYFKTNWGYLIEPGVEAWRLLVLYPGGIIYSDEDFDAVLDTATITVDLTGLPTCATCDVVVVPPGMDPSHREWRIRPLDIVRVGDVLTITGPRWLFVRPVEWMDVVDIPLDEDAAFLTGVDIYCHYNDSSTQAQYAWSGNGNVCLPVCQETCQDACVTVAHYRTGHFYAQPASYSPTTQQWTAANWAQYTLPVKLRIWYRAGYRDHVSGPCDWMGEEVKEAIVRLANCYLPEAPCGCGLTRERWERDREEQDINTLDIALAQSAFGTTARGAIFAHSVFKTLPPLGKGG